MNILFVTNIPSPYRVDFFNELGKRCTLTVCYERKSSIERDVRWKGDIARTYREVYLNLRPNGKDKSRGRALRKFISDSTFDFLILTNYASLSVIEAIVYCRINKIPYYLEYDGGLYKKDSLLLFRLKKYLIGGASGHLTTSDTHIKYLMSLKIPQSKIFKYPFTSISNKEIADSNVLLSNFKNYHRNKIGLKENKIILSVGRFSYDGGFGKGYDILLQICQNLSQDIGIYIVGDSPTDLFVKLKEDNNLTNLHYVGFKTKTELAEYYAAADIFVLLTRGDVWGLVINEAMAFGLPIITTNNCVAGLEMVYNGMNGFIVDLSKVSEITSIINSLLSNPETLFCYGLKSLEIIKDYTIEKMVDKHIEIFSNLQNKGL